MQRIEIDGFKAIADASGRNLTRLVSSSLKRQTTIAKNQIARQIANEKKYNISEVKKIIQANVYHNPNDISAVIYINDKKPIALDQLGKAFQNSKGVRVGQDFRKSAFIIKSSNKKFDGKVYARKSKARMPIIRQVVNLKEIVKKVSFSAIGRQVKTKTEQEIQRRLINNV